MKTSPRPKPSGRTLVDRVRKMLVRVPGVSEKKMFGSIAFMVRGKMCVTARAERIMCRIAPEQHDSALKRQGCETVVMRGREYRGYVHVRAEAVRTERALKYWVDLALAHSKTIEGKQRT
ncbi:MAG: TfoX/Sxy family protein [Opitutae bacterium]|nr:TfoX/Sxy family protein [Opitutae bacterium]